MKPKTCEIRVRRGERGSAYLIALMALVVLTILGLSLVLVTQTEVQVGANERTVNRTFYAADTGFHLLTSAHLAGNSSTAPPFRMNEFQAGTLGGKTADIIKLGPFAPAAANPLDSHVCPYCPSNEDGTKYYTKTYLLTSIAGHVAWTSGSAPTDPTALPVGATDLGQKTLSLTMIISPANSASTSTITDPTQLALISTK